MVFSEAEGRDLHEKVLGEFRVQVIHKWPDRWCWAPAMDQKEPRARCSSSSFWPDLKLYHSACRPFHMLSRWTCSHPADLPSFVQMPIKLWSQASLTDVASSSHPRVASWRLCCGSPAMLLLFLLEQSRQLACCCVVMAKHWNSYFFK